MDDVSIGRTGPVAGNAIEVEELKNTDSSIKEILIPLEMPVNLLKH